MLHVLGAGHYHPDIVISNKFIEELDLGTTTEWIIEKIGIENRRTTLPLDYIKNTRNQDPRQASKVASMSPTDMGAKACQMALQRANIKPDQIGLLICNCCSPYVVAPAEAPRISKALGIRCPSYDVFTACPAFALHIDMLNSYKEEKLPEYVMCVSTAALTHYVNYNDRTDGAIWGDGAAAWIVSAKHQGPLEVIYSMYQGDPSRCDAVAVDTHGFFHQDGRAIRDFSVRQTVRMIRVVEAEFSISWNQDIFIGHQANATMLDQITNNRGIPAANHWHNVEQYGNQAGAGAPASLSMRWGEFNKGQRIVVSVLGAGLSWGTVVMRVV